MAAISSAHDKGDSVRLPSDLYALFMPSTTNTARIFIIRRALDAAGDAAAGALRKPRSERGQMRE